MKKKASSTSSKQPIDKELLDAIQKSVAAGVKEAVTDLIDAGVVSKRRRKPVDNKKLVVAHGPKQRPFTGFDIPDAPREVVAWTRQPTPFALGGQFIIVGAKVRVITATRYERDGWPSIQLAKVRFDRDNTRIVLLPSGAIVGKSFVDVVNDLAGGDPKTVVRQQREAEELVKSVQLMSADVLMRMLKR